MNPENKNIPQTPYDTRLDTSVANIIHKRKMNAIYGAVIVSVIIIAYLFLSQPKQVIAIITAGGTVAGLLLLLSYANAQNYPTPRPSYRRLNKVVYIHMAKITIILSIINIISNIKDMLNPLHGFKDPGAPSRTELLFDTAVSAGLAGTMYSQLKPADQVEEYYKQLTYARLTRPE